jgi:hypothetical protein
MCAMCGYAACTNEATCVWTCQKCHCRFPGALGFGEHCRCPEAWKRTQENLNKMIGSGAIHTIRQAIEDEKNEGP